MERYQTSWGSEGPNANKDGFLFFFPLNTWRDGQDITKHKLP